MHALQPPRNLQWPRPTALGIYPRQKLSIRPNFSHSIIHHSTFSSHMKTLHSAGIETMHHFSSTQFSNLVANIIRITIIIPPLNQSSSSSSKPSLFLCNILWACCPCRHQCNRAVICTCHRVEESWAPLTNSKLPSQPLISVATW